MSILKSAMVLAAILSCCGISEAATSCSGTNLAKFGGVTPALVDGAIVYSTRTLNVDADGAPNSYLINGKGLSRTCDGVVAIENGQRISPPTEGWEEKCKAAWALARKTSDYSHVAIFGFIKDAAGKPAVQKDGDPYPGTAFISSTSVAIPGTPDGTQRHYVDATAIPYIVLPGGFVSAHGVKPGAIAAAYFPKTGKIAFAVFGDSGGALDEASVRLHQDLGSNPLVVKNGVTRAKARIEIAAGADPVSIVVFPKIAPTRSADSTAWRSAIATAGADAFKTWGGIDRLKQCAK